jgi:plasmid maintenance system antidote protein VapI
MYMSRADHVLDDVHARNRIQAKVHQSGRGRHANRISETENPLGSFLQSAMEHRGITQTDFARRLGISRDKVRRLIFRDLIEIQSSLAECIVQVLDLNDTEREKFSRLLIGNRRIEPLSQALPEEGISVAVGAASEGVWLSLPREGASHVPYLKGRETAEEKHADERGRKAAEPGTDMGRFLVEHLDARGMKRSDLAKAINVTPSTITRFIQGNIAVISADSRERIIRELGLDEASRLEFNRLTVQRQRADISVHKFSHIDLDKLTEYLQKLQGFYEKGGYAAFVELETRQCYRLLRSAGFSKKESRAIELQWRFGMLCGSANEAAVEWEERVLPTIRFYDLLEKEIDFRGIPPLQAEIYIAHIQARRAPLYRQLGNYQESLKQFSDALDVYAHYLNKPEDRRLLVELYYSRAHVYAVQGMKERWERDIERARLRAEEEKDEKHRRELVGLVVYTQGEGYKRLAFHEGDRFSKDMKEDFARKGLELFRDSHMEESKWVGHGILNGVARAQCMALIDPEVAMKDAERLRTEALQLYPSIVQKINRIIDYARKHLQ